MANDQSSEHRDTWIRSIGASPMKIWGILLVAYVLLLAGTGYVAFFQPAYNPATDIDDTIEALIEQESTREFTLEALREEGTAFKQRRELSVQSFNIVLGAALGFLSALASQALLKRQRDGGPE